MRMWRMRKRKKSRMTPRSLPWATAVKVVKTWEGQVGNGESSHQEFSNHHLLPWFTPSPPGLAGNAMDFLIGKKPFTAGPDFSIHLGWTPRQPWENEQSPVGCLPSPFLTKLLWPVSHQSPTATKVLWKSTDAVPAPQLLLGPSFLVWERQTVVFEPP